MLEKIKAISESVKKLVSEADASGTLNEIKVKFLGKNGEITALLKNLKNCTPEEKPFIGKHINILREQVEKLLAEREKALAEAELNKKIERRKVRR